MFTDARIIARAGAYEVLATAAEPQWPDRSSLAFHVARQHRHHPAELYAVLFQPPARLSMPRHSRWVVLDVRTLARSLADDLPAALWHDRPGVLKLTLQRDYPSAGVCMARVLANARAEWRHEPDTILPEPPPAPARFIQPQQRLAA